MPADIHERAMASEERSYLQNLIGRKLNPFEAFRREAGFWIFMWVLEVALLVAAWLVVAWLVGVATGANIGLHSPVAGWAITLAAAASAVSLLFEVSRQSRHRKRFQRSLLADLATNRIVEEHYAFTDAIRMQEQEHGGLIYFLRSTNGDVLVLYDSESQDIGVQGDDPMSSSFQPCRRLTIVRVPESGLVIARTFTGEPLDAGDPLDLMAPPDKWPEDEAFCDIPWDELEAKLCR